MRYKIPDGTELARTLEMLLGKEIHIQDQPEWPTDPAELAVIYRDPEDEPVAISCCDRAFAAYAGCALTMLPPARAESVLGGEELNEMMQGNLYEVMNVISRYMMSDKTPHLRLAEVASTAALEDQCASVINGALGKHGYKVDVDGYGSGWLGVAVT